MAKKVFTIIPILIIIGAIIILVIPRRSPVERAIDGAIDAVNSHDLEGFCRYVDIKGLIKSYADFDGERSIDLHSYEGGAETISEHENEIRYFIENGRIPDPNRFRNVIATRIGERNSEVLIAIYLKKYSAACTLSIHLRISSDSKWQITGINLRRIWSNIKKAADKQGNLSKSAGSERRQLENGKSIEQFPPVNENSESTGLTPEGMIRDIIFDSEN